MISIDKTGEHFRLIYDVKGRFTVHRITAEEAKVSALALQPEERVPSGTWTLQDDVVAASVLICVCSTSCAR